jgi:hypothetical protein
MERTITITEKRFKEICAEVCAETTVSLADKMKGTGVLIFGLTASMISAAIGERLFPKESEALD